MEAFLGRDDYVKNREFLAMRIQIAALEAIEVLARSQKLSGEAAVELADSLYKLLEDPSRLYAATVQESYLEANVYYRAIKTVAPHLPSLARTALIERLKGWDKNDRSKPYAENFLRMLERS